MRRAWIEIEIRFDIMEYPQQSPSMRRAWIEISSKIAEVQQYIVALHAEGVDRNGMACREL